MNNTIPLATSSQTAGLATAVALGASLLIATPALADDHRWELTGGANHTVFDSDRDLEDATGGHLGLGYVLDKNWTLEGLVADFETELEDFDIDIDGRYYRLDALYHLESWGDWRPFVVMGVGDVEFDPDNLSSVNETQINLGFGLKRLLSHAWQLRGDARAFHSLDEEDTDYGVNLSLSYLFGATGAKSAKVKGPVDSDGDGVVDSADACPDTPAGAPVDAKGCPLDGDGDGVFDYQDNCPATKPDVVVDHRGCPKVLTETVTIELKVNFDTDSAVVKPEYFAEIKQVADFMAQYADTVVTVEGHTDDRGAASYNKALSQRRADAVRQVLIEQMGIGAARVKAVGLGEESPVASNDTREGRLANRRVVAKISSQVERTITK